jgi:hypothetical protein
MQATIYAVNGLYNTFNRLGLKASDIEDVNTYRKSLMNLAEISKRYQDENVYKTSEV